MAQHSTPSKGMGGRLLSDDGVGEAKQLIAPERGFTMAHVALQMLRGALSAGGFNQRFFFAFFSSQSWRANMRWCKISIVVSCPRKLFSISTLKWG